MRIEWLPQALADFDDAMNWIAERNPQAARQSAEAVYRQIAQLTAHPHIGRIGRVPKTRELVISQTHFVTPYRVKTQENLIEILAFMHNARQWPENF
jgi:toxin ParE1/3/4